MKTPSFESIDDQKREERVAGFLEGLWGVSCHKLPVSYSLDYWIESVEKRNQKNKRNHTKRKR